MFGEKSVLPFWMTGGGGGDSENGGSERGREGGERSPLDDFQVTSKPSLLGDDRLAFVTKKR